MAINRSQFITGSVASASSVNVVFSSAVSSGSLIVVHHALYGSVANSLFSNIVDNVNANNYTVGSFSTLTSDTHAQNVIAYKLNISSGGAASTYRISVNSSAAVGARSVVAIEYTGGPFTVGSTGSSNGVGTAPRGPVLTASSTPPLFVVNASHGGNGVFSDTVNVGTWIATLNPNNVTGQILWVAESTNSSLTQQPTATVTISTTAWVATEMVFLGLGSGGAAAATGAPWGFCMSGVQ